MPDASDIANLRPIGFDALAGWADDDHAAAFAAFRRGADVLVEHPPKLRDLGLDPVALARTLEEAGSAGDLTATDAREFFETRFVPHIVGGDEQAGHFTGYYEPEVEGSRSASDRHSTPLLATPDDLVELGPADDASALPEGFRFARKTASGLEEHPDRGAIQAGALSGRGLELVHLADPVEAFFIHIQGAARIRLAEGGSMRVTYAAKSGHPYTPIGRVLIDEGELPRGGATMQTIRAWLGAHPERRDEILAANRSYIFFREAPVDEEFLGPVAAAKVPLTPGRSIAVDRTLHAFHAPVWVETALPSAAPYRRLMVAQDTGSAILGPARGDLFFGSGNEAGEIAGEMNGRGKFVLFVPRSDR